MGGGRSDRLILLLFLPLKVGQKEEANNLDRNLRGTWAGGKGILDYSIPGSVAEGTLRKTRPRFCTTASRISRDSMMHHWWEKPFPKQSKTFYGKFQLFFKRKVDRYGFII